MDCGMHEGNKDELNIKGEKSNFRVYTKRNLVLVIALFLCVEEKKRSHAFRLCAIGSCSERI